jgi:hypothetical protein
MILIKLLNLLFSIINLSFCDKFNKVYKKKIKKKINYLINARTICTFEGINEYNLNHHI